MAKKQRPPVVSDDRKEEVDRLKKRLDMLDERLDNIDSMVTAVAERVMSRPITLNMICPHCGKGVEIDIMGNEKPGR